MCKTQSTHSRYYHTVPYLLKVITLPFIVLLYVLPAGFILILKGFLRRLKVRGGGNH